MSTDDRPTIDEFIDTLTGFEEIAIKGAFGEKPAELGAHDRTGVVRSLFFVAKKREGLKDNEAKHAALAATIGEVQAIFSDDDDEPTPDDPITESGKGEPELLPTPSNSQPSVSEPASNPPSTPL